MLVLHPLFPALAWLVGPEAVSHERMGRALKELEGGTGRGLTDGPSHILENILCFPEFMKLQSFDRLPFRGLAGKSIVKMQAVESIGLCRRSSVGNIILPFKVGIV